MIPWQKYDPENPPEKNREFFISNGKAAGVGYLSFDHKQKLEWWSSATDGLLTGISHYAPINLPGEETK